MLNRPITTGNTGRTTRMQKQALTVLVILAAASMVAEALALCQSSMELGGQEFALAESTKLNVVGFSQPSIKYVTVPGGELLLQQKCGWVMYQDVQQLCGTCDLENMRHSPSSPSPP